MCFVRLLKNLITQRDNQFSTEKKTKNLKKRKLQKLFKRVYIRIIYIAYRG